MLHPLREWMPRLCSSRTARPAVAVLAALLMATASPLAAGDITVELHPDNDVRVVNGNDLSAAGDDSAGPSFLEAPPENTAAVTVRFPRFNPDTYILGSGEDLELIVDGVLPQGAKLDIRAWDLSERYEIPGFGVSLTASDWTIPAELLDRLPVGQVELRAVLSAPGLRNVEIAQRYLVLPEGSEPVDLETWYDVPLPEYIEAGTEPPELIAGEGFVEYTPAPGQQIYYVSETGSDKNDGLTEATPLRTLVEAYRRVGDGDGDWILLKAGDTFSGGFDSFRKSGKSKDEPFLVGVYGEGDRPVVLTNGDGFITSFGRVSHVVLEGIYVLANKRQPKEYGIYWLASGTDITLQDMKIEGFIFNVVFQALEHGLISDVVMRRCIILDSYGHYEGHKGGHSSGLFMKNVTNALIDECTFDHNGWHPDIQGATRTKFNHNIYVQKDCRYVDVYRSLFFRGAHHGVQLRCGGEMINNTFIRNALAAYVAQDPSVMSDNVVLEADDMNPNNPLFHRGSGLEILPCSDALVENNLVLDKVGQAAWAGGIEVKWRSDVVDPPPTFNVTIRNNTVARWHRKGGKAIADWSGKANVTYSGNLLDEVSGGEPLNFVDPSRTHHTYLPGGFDAFIEGARNRSRGTWDPTYGAATFNNWMRQGYQLR